jgi:DNA-binding MarR family transcriptional regulator
MTGSVSLRDVRPVSHESGNGAQEDDNRNGLLRWELAAARHRIVLGRRLGLAETEVLAVQHLIQADELTPGALGDLLQLSSGGVTAMVSRLERAGYVARRRHPQDKRRALLRPTPALRARAAEAWAPLIANIDAVVGSLSQREQRLIGDVVTRLTQAIDHHADRLVSEVMTTERDALSVPEPGRWS